MMSGAIDNPVGFSWLVVIGTSWGGIQALKSLLKLLKSPFSFTVVVVIHQDRHTRSQLSQLLTDMAEFRVIEASDKEPLSPGNVYISTPNYHLLVEQDGTLSHTVDIPVNFSRPSVDVLFQTAADAFADRVVAIVLTGANQDGAVGVQRVKMRGGQVLVQDPKEAEAKAMPLAAIGSTDVDFIGSLGAIAERLNNLENTSPHESK